MVDGLKKHQRSVPYNPKNTSRAREMRKNMTVAEKELWFGFLNGDSHFTQMGIEYDTERTKVFESLGIKVIRLTNKEVLFHLDRVCERIDSFADE
jgi:very-short-patch-repair endonuclease